MSPTRKELALENLLMAAIAGLLAVLAAVTILIVRSSDVTRECAALSSLSGRPVAAKALQIDDPAILRLYRVQGQGPSLFGASLTLESRSGTALAVALVAPDGELKAVSLMDTTGARSPFTQAGWFADELGKGGSSPYPSDIAASRSPAALSGATESFLQTTAVFQRLSDTVRTLAKEEQ